MTRQITDRVTVGLPERRFNLKWLLIGIVIACVIGGVVGGYLTFNKTTSTITIPKPPTQLEVVPPVIPDKTSKSTQSPAFQKIEVEWKTSGLVNAKEIVAISIEDNKGNVVYAVGTRPSDVRPIQVWKSKNGTNSWEYVGTITNSGVDFSKKEEIYQNFVVTSKGMSGFSSSSANTIIIADKELYLLSYAFPPQNPKKVDRNDSSNILQPAHTEMKLNKDGHPFEAWYLLLSLNGGRSWIEVNLPPPYDYGVQGNSLTHYPIFWYQYDLISHEGKLKLFFTKERVWQAEISLPK